MMVELLLVVGLFQADHPIPEADRKKMALQLEANIKAHTERLKAKADSVDDLSKRGDCYFNLGRFDAAVADYDRMVELDPKLASSHWRRGIAYFYAGSYEKAAKQFEEYHTYDDVDRENGIWRFLSQTKAYGLKQAREGLLKYKKDDREPFPLLYELFAGKTTPEKILESINDAQIDDDERSKRLFYARLYIGLNLAVEGNEEAARKHLRMAVGNSWGPNAGYGPRYMWEVGRLTFELLSKAK